MIKSVRKIDQLPIKLNPSALAFFCRKHGIRILSFFGSVLRNDFNANSDIDILVEFVEGQTPSYFELFDMEEQLSLILGDRKVDLRTRNDLSRYFRNEIVKHAVVAYES